MSTNLISATKYWSINGWVVTDGDSIERSEIVYTYQVLPAYHQFVLGLATAREEFTGETESMLHVFSKLIVDKREEFGEVTAAQD